jgi:hypothetical protein
MWDEQYAIIKMKVIVVMTGQDRTGQDRTGQDRTGQDRTDPRLQLESTVSR